MFDGYWYRHSQHFSLLLHLAVCKARRINVTALPIRKFQNTQDNGLPKSSLRFGSILHGNLVYGIVDNHDVSHSGACHFRPELPVVRAPGVGRDGKNPPPRPYLVRVRVSTPQPDERRCFTHCNSHLKAAASV